MGPLAIWAVLWAVCAVVVATLTSRVLYGLRQEVREGGIPDVAKVVDFGLVEDLECGGAALPRADIVQGTPLYLSPEAITAPDRVDPRGDLYALGAVGYFMLTGKHVFSGATLVEVCSHHLHSRWRSRRTPLEKVP